MGCAAHVHLSIHHFSFPSPPHSTSINPSGYCLSIFLLLPSPLCHPLPAEPLLSPAVPVSIPAIPAAAPGRDVHPRGCGAHHHGTLTAASPMLEFAGAVWGWCRRGRELGAAPGGTRRQTGNEHRPSPLPAGADGSPRLRGKSRAGEGTGVTGAGARRDRDGHWPHKQPHIHAWGLSTTRERLWQRWGAAPWLAGVLLVWLFS